MNSADLHTEISTIMPIIIGLLSDNSSKVRWASINTLSKFTEHGKNCLLCCIIC